MKIVSEFPHKITVQDTVWITLKDGTKLAARLWLPEGAEETPVPGILEYLPYRRSESTRSRDDRTQAYLSGHGYACLRVDIRGNGDSDGLMEDEYTAQELSDGVEVIEWMAAQPWCSGSVGMMGISWGGFNALQVAALQPEALKAIVTVCSTDDRYADDIHYMGGCLLNDNLTWSSQMLAFSSRSPVPATVGENWKEIWKARLDAQPLLAVNWLKHQHRDAFWKHGSICEDYNDIQAAVLAVGGWADAYSNAVPRLLENLTAPCRGIVGPWIHKYPHIAYPEPSIGFLQEMLRWWDQWLKGQDTRIMEEPKYRAFLIEGLPATTHPTEVQGRWVAEEDWPSANISWQDFCLSKTGLASAGAAAVTLSQEDDVVTLSTPQTLGADCGSFCAGMRNEHEYPGDQKLDDLDALVFDTAPLEEDFNLLGAPMVELQLKSDKPQAIVALRIGDVAPDGRVTRVSYMPFNLTHHLSHEHPQALVPDEIFEVAIQMNDAGYVFKKGHRIRLSLSNSYWPMVWPSPESTELTLFLSGCHLQLPSRADREEDQAIVFQETVTSPDSPQEKLRPAFAEKKVVRDVATGRVTVTTEDDYGAVRFLDNGLMESNGIEQRFSILPDDPNSAEVEVTWVNELSRGEWHTHTETWSRMTSDATTFYVEARATTFIDGEVFHEKTWQEALPRNLV
ncbi:CocE/NonD family hydrolase [Rhodovibrionaceae bacterium A322]